jgi:hypothetical protein
MRSVTVGKNVINNLGSGGITRASTAIEVSKSRFTDHQVIKRRSNYGNRGNSRIPRTSATSAMCSSEALIRGANRIDRRNCRASVSRLGDASLRGMVEKNGRFTFGHGSIAWR